MYLIINNTILPYFVGLIRKEKLIYLSFKKERVDLLKIITKFIKKNKIEINRIQGLVVISDSSSFTKLRITLTIANIFSKFLNIPISWLSKDEVKSIDQAIKQGIKRMRKRIILPVYHKEPNISLPRNDEIIRKHER